MAVPRKLVAVPNAATRELWRVAESGAIDDLAAVLPQADINARNEHGMTALMRAAYHGRVQMVRELLDHGADPNVTRNDNFTALSLAAFFGHAEIVDILMRHGANTDVATRFGTSPYIWAKARSYGDVARSLENRIEDPTPPAPSLPSVSRVVETDPEPIVVRTLKEPPEIWDLVHEAPRNYSASSAFIARMGSIKGAFVIALALFVVIGAGAGAWFLLKERVSLPSVAAPTATATTTAPAPPAPVITQPEATNNAPSETAPAPVVQNEVNTTVPRKPRSFAKARAVSSDVNVNDSTATQPVAVPPPVTMPKPESKPTVDTAIKNTTPPPNPQMISPPKTSPPKGKVIQWP